MALPQATLPSLPQTVPKGLPFDVLLEITKKSSAAYYALTTAVPELGRYSRKPHVQTIMKAHFTVKREFDNGIEWLLPNGKRHSNYDKPAMVREDYRFINGKFEENETQFWYKNGKLHREGDAAIIHGNGDKFWYQNGIPYRADDKPHVVLGNGSREWYNAAGQLHRDNGPALILENGKEYWYRDGIRLLRP